MPIYTACSDGDTGPFKAVLWSKTIFGHLCCKNKLPLIKHVPCVTIVAFGKTHSFSPYSKHQTPGAVIYISGWSTQMIERNSLCTFFNAENSVHFLHLMQAIPFYECIAFSEKNARCFLNRGDAEQTTCYHLCISVGSVKVGHTPGVFQSCHKQGGWNKSSVLCYCILTNIHHGGSSWAASMMDVRHTHDYVKTTAVIITHDHCAPPFADDHLSVGITFSTCLFYWCGVTFLW